MKCVRVHRAQRGIKGFFGGLLLTTLGGCVSPAAIGRTVELLSLAQRVVATTPVPPAANMLKGSDPAPHAVVGGPPQIDTTNLQWKNWDTRLCMLPACGYSTYSYSTVPYVSMDQPRSLTLVWNAKGAGPRHTVLLDVRDTNTTKTADVISIKVRDSVGNVLAQSRGSGQSEMYFQNHQGSGRRIAIWFYNPIWALPTGAYHFTATVKSYYTDSTTDSVNVPVKWLQLNERDNPIGAGWSIAGLQRLHKQSDSSLVLTDGTGTLQFYEGPCTGSPCAFKSPPGEFSTITKHALSSDSTIYDRTDSFGNVVGFNAAGYQLIARDRFGNTTRYAYDVTTGRLRLVTDPMGKQTTLTVDTSPSPYGGPNIRITDPANRVTQIQQDTLHDVKRIVDPSDTAAFTGYYFGSNSHGLNYYQDRANGDIWYTRTDCSGRYHGEITPAIMVGGVATTTRTTVVDPSVDALGCMNSDGSSNSLGYLRTSPAPSIASDSARARVTDANGNVTTYKLDRFGAPIRVEEPLGRVTVMDRDSMSRVTHTRTALGHALSYIWSGPVVTEHTDSTRGRTYIDYFTSPYNIRTNGSGYYPSVLTTLDSTGKFIEKVSIGGDSATVFLHDSMGRDTAVIDPMGHVTRYHFATSGWGNLYEVVQTNGTTTTKAFDYAGRDSVIINARGDATTFVWDVLNRQKSIIGPLNDVTTFTYDFLFLKTVTDARQQTWRYYHNALGWVYGVEDPQGNGTWSAFDPNGNVVQMTNRRGWSTTMTYDALNRRLSLNTDSHSPERSTTFAYSSDFRSMRAADSASTDSVVVDALGRVVREWSKKRNNVTSTVESAYDDSLDTRKTVTWNGNRTVSYVYDNKVRLTGLVQPGFSDTTTFPVYDRDRLQGKINYPTGFGDSLGYSRFHDANMHLFTPSGGAIDHAFQTTAHVDSLGRIDKRFRYPAGANDTLRTFSYDAAGRLAGDIDYLTGLFSCGWDSEHNRYCGNNSPALIASRTYTYDAVGNLVDSLGTPVNPGDRVLTYRNHHLSYDTDGNVYANQTDGIRVDIMHWNQLNELVQFDFNWVPKVKFEYDGFGRRVSKTVMTETDTTTTYYQWDGDQVIADLNQYGSYIAEYVFLPGVDQLHSVLHSGSTRMFSVKDAEGNVAGLVSGSPATVSAQYRYTPFGELERNDASASTNTLRFQGRPYDSETGLYYFRARYYDPVMRRFLSEDPIGLAGGINPYVFAGNDPVNRRDPSGLDPICTNVWIRTARVTTVSGNTEITSIQPGYWTESCIDVPPQFIPDGISGGLGGAGGTSHPGLPARACSSAQVNLAITAIGDASFFLAGAGAAVRGVSLAMREARTIDMIVNTARLANTNRLEMAYAGRATALSSAGLGVVRAAGGYFSYDGLHATLAQGDVDWRDFVPGFATAKALGQMREACGK